MNAIRFIFIGVFLFTFYIKSMGQGLLVDFSYIKSAHSLEVRLTNNTGKQMSIHNDNFVSNRGSRIVFVGKSSKETSKELSITLWEIQNMTGDSKILSPHESIRFSHPIDSYVTGKVEKAILTVVFIGWDDAIGKFRRQECEKEVQIGD